MRRILCGFGILLSIALPACDKETKTVDPGQKNHAPEVTALFTRPGRVLASQQVTAICQARDEDRQFLKFWWSASAGSFPAGNAISSVTWVSPPVIAPQTLQVWVTDFIDTVTARMDVSVARVAAPESLRFVNGANLVNLSWSAGPDSAVEFWSGYEVFAAPHSLAGLPLDSVLAYRITGLPLTRLEYRITNAVAGNLLYCHIRSRRDYLGLVERSEAGPEIDTAARLDGFGPAPLFEVASRRGPAGIHLPGGTVETLDAAQRDRIDLYLGTSDPRDQGGSLLLKSPSLLAYRDPAWADRVTGFADLGSVWDVAVPPAEGAYAQELPLKAGGIYALRTADDHFAKIRILELRGSPPERRIEFQWAWQPKPGYPRF